MQLNFLSFFLMTILVCSAQASRFVVDLGLGSSSSKDEATYSEGPLLQSYTFEFDMDSSTVLGAEHVRGLGLSPLSTAISSTGLVFKKYVVGSPTSFSDLNSQKINSIESRDFCFFYGGSIGLSQSSALADNGANRSTAGIYISPKLGFDFPMGANWGLRSELIFLLTALGKGTTSSAGVAGGIYYTF